MEVRRNTEVEAALVAKFAAIGAVLNEKTRRLWAATESRAIGYGGDALVSAATGLARETIRKGRMELEAGLEQHDRIRRPGAGRPFLTKTQPGLGDECPVHAAITYLQNQGERMGYVAARKLGLPIGSGNVEATCKSLIGQRLVRTGARWKEDTGQHVIDLRALALSERFDAALDLTVAPLVRHISRAA